MSRGGRAGTDWLAPGGPGVGHRAGLRGARVSAMIPPMTESKEDTGAKPAESTPGSGADAPLDMNLVKFPFLISGIMNAIAGLSWILLSIILIFMVVGCLTLPLAIGMGVLAVFEILVFVHLHQEKKPRPTKKKLKILAICEIATILLFNIPSVACGVWTLLQLEKYDENG